MVIIFAYKGEGKYLEHTVRQAALASDKHRVIALTDYDPAPGFCEWHKWDDYADGADEFESMLNHKKFYKAKAFSRALVIRNLCEKHGIDRCFNADWDVVITTDIGKICDLWSWADFTMSICKESPMLDIPGGRMVLTGHASHSMLTSKALNAFVKFARGACKRRSHGSEMFVWTEFAYMGGLKWADTYDILDHNLGTQIDQYETVQIQSRRYKLIEWTSSGPMKIRNDGMREPMPIIHCWYESKLMIPEFCSKLDELRESK